jgi:hypothetical protein
MHVLGAEQSAPGPNPFGHPKHRRSDPSTCLLLLLGDILHHHEISPETIVSSAVFCQKRPWRAQRRATSLLRSCTLSRSASRCIGSPPPLCYPAGSHQSNRINRILFNLQPGRGFWCARRIYFLSAHKDQPHQRIDSIPTTNVC